MKWLPDMDLNHDKQIQSLLCYRYTIGQDGEVKILSESRSPQGSVSENFSALRVKFRCN